MSREVILTCAINGGGTAALAEHPAIPITPGDIAKEVMHASQNGAAIAHIHVRDPQTGHGSNSFELYSAVVAMVRSSGTDIVLNLTCSMASLVSLEWSDGLRLADGTSLAMPIERIRHALELKPEIATIDCGVFGIGESIFVGRPSDLRSMAVLMRDAGIRPELECFDLGQIETAKKLIEEGYVEKPSFIQLCLGTGYGAPDTLSALEGMRAQLPAQSIWAAFGCGRNQLGLVPHIVRAGGHIRVGLEDTRFMPDGSKATNASLIAAAANIVRSQGCSLATPAQARQILKLKGA
ncbi:3-keto-5-aminohexanoate cleavage protein [Phyllobacterium sp. SB3]|uniref:3-keto-5-aminohexanoate cleavage protein n=1 Tax=Phyllobacterium sp. SB3 TaxID=3156073 RepID=UPI0032AEEE70